MNSFKYYLEAVKSRKGQFKETILGLIKQGKLPKDVSSEEMLDSAERQINKLKKLKVPGAFGITINRIKKSLGLK